MLLTMLVLTAQAAPATPPANAAAQAAMQCANATVVAGREVTTPLRVTSQFMYFAMQAAKAERAGDRFLPRLGELAGLAPKLEIPDDATAKTRIADCDKRFPLARANITPRLPNDSFNRDVMCLGVLSLLQGASEEIAAKEGSETSLQRVQAAIAPYAERLTDEVLTAKGFVTEASFSAAMGAQIEASMALGNPESVARACGMQGA